MTTTTVLIVEDEKDILELVNYNLQQVGFHTICVEAGDVVLDLAKKEHPNLIILDLMLPGISGTEVCKMLKQSDETKAIPIIILTAKGEEIDRVVGFELGADDYVTKPFSPRELVLRVKAILKRMSKSEDKKEIIQLQGLTIDKPRHRVELSGETINLTSTEFKLLLTLVERRGRVQTRDILLGTVWGYEYSGFTRTVDTHMRRLRSKLGAWGDKIETVRGIGYRVKERE